MIDKLVEEIEAGRISAVTEMLLADPALVDTRHDGATPLHFAAFHNDFDIADLLIEAGADLDAIDEEHGATPAGWANEKGNTHMVHHLRQKGAYIDLHQAAAFGLLDLVKKRLNEHPDQINKLQGFGAPLHFAALWGHPSIVSFLLEQGAGPNLENADGRTALAIARIQVDSECADTRIVTDKRREAMLRGCTRVVEILGGR